MAGRGPAPADPTKRRRRNAPTRGEWKAAPGIGWQHGPLPDAPDGLCPTAAAAWTAWMQSWIAANWGPEDLPGLRIAVELYDQCERAFEDPYIERVTAKGDSIFVLRPNPSPVLRQYLDTYGISKKGQQDRRWSPPPAEEKPVVQPKGKPATKPTRYAHLRVATK